MFTRWSLIRNTMICIRYLNVNSPLRSITHLGVVFLNYNTDKEQDGTFRWVDKTAVEFSNWSPNFPQNSANQWDCGQIYTGKIDHWVTERLRDWPLNPERHTTTALKDFLVKIELNLFFSLVIGNYAGKWETTNCFKNLGYICKMPGGQNVQPTAAPGENRRLLMLVFRTTQTFPWPQFYREGF